MGYYNNAKHKEEIDFHLKSMAIIFANTGKDSTFEEMKRAYILENQIINDIGKIDPEFQKIIRPYTDESGGVY